MTSRAQLHEIVDMLPESELASAQRLLQALPEDPVLRALLAAPLDDEPVTDEDRGAIEEAEASILTHGTISTAELRRRLGLRKWRCAGGYALEIGESSSSGGLTR